MSDKHRSNPDQPRHGYPWMQRDTLITSIGVGVMFPVVLYAMYRIMIAPLLSD